MEYTWLSEYQRTWEEVKETKEDIKEKKKEGQYLRPLLRRLILALDYSKACLKKDLRPSRYKLISKYSEKFWDLFYSCNPLSKLQILLCKNGKAFLSESKEELFTAAEGEFSLQNTLEMSLMLLSDSGPHWSNEVLIILNSLSSCDNGNVWSALEKLVESHVRVNIISTCAVSNLIRSFSHQTGGKTIVVTSENSLKDSWDDFAKSGFPSPSAALIPMSFALVYPIKTPCACHCEMREGFICSVCRAVVCQIPSQCPVCSRFLVSPPHLAKAALSIKPLPPFISFDSRQDMIVDLPFNECEGCDVVLENIFVKCQSCNAAYCELCQEFLQASLGKCIGCSFN
jgi:transcription initiation factor TFIIH subunit 2